MENTWMEAARIESERAICESGCRGWPDFLLSLSSAAPEQARPAAHRPLQTVILTDDYDRDSAWFLNLVPAKFTLLCLSGRVAWGVEALLIAVDEHDEELQLTLGALASLPHVDSLFLHLSYPHSSTPASAASADGARRNSTALKADALRSVELLQDHSPTKSPESHNDIGDAMKPKIDAVRHVLQSSRAAHLHLIYRWHEEFDESMAEALLCNTSLTAFELSESIIPANSLHHLFASLQNSSFLTSLALRRCKFGPGWSKTALLDSLRQNAIFHELDLSGTPLDRDAAIKAQLRKNAENANRLHVLRSRCLEPPVRPSTIRLYLCGLPFAGKSTLRRSLAKYASSSTSLPACLPTSFLQIPRTRGIEVTVIEKPGGQARISVWDMAGQLEYHAFHDSMLPDLNDRAISPLFLYVWSPFESDVHGKLRKDAHGQTRRKHVNNFLGDFRYWLRFIASKAPRSQNFKPKVIIAITRKDVGFQDTRAWLLNALTSLRSDFQDYIEFDMEGFFEVDARDPTTVSPLASYLFDTATSILNSASLEFKVCEEARKFFQQQVYDGKIPPLISKLQYGSLCKKYLAIKSEVIHNAISQSLTASGDLIHYPHLELVVIDTEWFCHKIMGDLLHFNIDASHIDCSGFFGLSLLQNLLEKEVNARTIKKWRTSLSKFKFWDREFQEVAKVKGDALVSLLLGLKLACRRDHHKEDSDIFIPASLSGKVGENAILRGEYLNVDESSTVIGRRLAVKDKKCTFLTPGIFPNLQVTFHNILTMQEIHVDLNQDVMAFGMHGARVFVEFCRVEGHEDFIDVLLCFHKKTLDEGLEWTHENVLDKMNEVFADPKGIPGVEIEYSIIQPASIKGLMEARDRQVVSIDNLHYRLRNHLEKKGANLTNDGIKSIIHTWQRRPFVDEPIENLLGKVEVSKIVDAYKSCLIEVARDVLNIHVIEERNKYPPKPQFGTSQSSKERECIYDYIDDFRKEMKVDMENLLHQVDDLRTIVLSKLSTLFTFIKDEEAGKLPRMFVLTHNNGSVHRLISKMVPGLHNYCLQLLCECRDEPSHLLDGQHGLSIATLDDGLLKRGLPYINGFLKVAYVVAKMGAHIAVGYGDAIPDFSRVLANIVDTEVIVPLETTSNLSSRVDLRGGQQWLLDVLRNQNCISGDQIHAIFGLRRIRYADLRVAWVCDKHYSRGDPWPA